MTWRISLGDCIERLAELPPDSIDSVVTDPPYGIGFMGHDWDQPGEFGPLRANGDPAPFAGGRRAEGPHVAGGSAALERQMARSSRRATQRDPSTGAGHAYERSRRNTQGPGSTREGAVFGGPSGADHTQQTARGGAMHAGRYDLSPSANRRFQAWCEAWGAECLRVLKPGGYLAAFGSTRTSHRLTAGLEDAGFEIRDALVWLFGSGFPKATGRHLVPEPWQGSWNTALKPGHEPIVLARKPMVGTLAENLLAHGTGAMNIAGCAIDVEDPESYRSNASGDRGHAGTRPVDPRTTTDLRQGGASAAAARWPANVLLDPEAAEQLDEQSGILISGANPTRRGSDKVRDVYGAFPGQEECEPARGVDVGGASRFYYCAKTSRAERNAGLNGPPTDIRGPRFVSGGLKCRICSRWKASGNPCRCAEPDFERIPFESVENRNHHPTVKPISLMRWLTKLLTPEGGSILDPFAGSGSTGCAAVLEAFTFIGVERDPEYLKIAEARIRWWAAHPGGTELVQALDAEHRRRAVAQTGQLAMEVA